MLDILHRDGRGRVAQWKPGTSTSATKHAKPAKGEGGPEARTPTLIWPDTALASAPAWIRCVVTADPKPQGNLIELVSQGTWFHPIAQEAAITKPSQLLVPATPTAPSTTVQLVKVGDELAIFHDAAGWAGNPRNLVPAFAKARTDATSARLLWAPGIGTPADYAVWSYLGVDLFDASPLLLAAARGEGLTIDGPVDATQAARLSGSKQDSLDFDSLVAFSAEQARQELERIHAAIIAGNLRFLAERRCYASAATVEMLRRFDREHTLLETAAPHHRTVQLTAMTAESLWMPEVEAFRRRLRNEYQPPEAGRVLVLLPCSQRKPYKTSRSHRAFARALDDSGIRHELHEVMITSPLGLVPRELEEVYPANQYDIPVTGHWTRDEEAIVKEQLAALLDKHDYEHVIVHASQSTFDVFRHLLPEDRTRHTCLHHPTSFEDLGRLRAELARLKPLLAQPPAQGNGREQEASEAEHGRPVAAAPNRNRPFAAARDRRLDDLHSLLTFQFGPAIAADLTRDATTHGRMPHVKLARDSARGEARGAQLGQITPERGVLSLTLDGAAVLAAHGRNRVLIGDFWPKGTSSLFAVGVESADANIRPGDEVVVLHGDEVRGCGVAEMSGEEMTSLRRGIAVTLRHAATPAPAKAKPLVEVA